MTKGRISRLDAVAAQLTSSLHELPTPMYVVDRRGHVLWLNRSGIELVGAKAIGRAFSSVVSLESLGVARRNFVSKVMGEADATRFVINLRSRHGSAVPVEVSSVPLRDEQNDIVGVLGVAQVQENGGEAARPQPPPTTLTPRQYEVLELLAEGRSTSQIATQLSITEDTVRNHIRGVLRELGVHTRLEAVVLALRSGWL